MRRLVSFAALAAILVTAAFVAAQVRVDVRLVNVVATVMDTNGRYVSGLTADDFILEEDGRRQEIAHFSQDQDVPVSVGVVLDTSGSMERKIGTAIEAVDRFVRRIHQADEVFLITFSSEAVLRQDFTDNRDMLTKALRRLPATGGTALYDALMKGLAKIRSGRNTKRAMLVITDGQDTSSEARLDDALQGIRASELLVYPIGISPLSRPQTSSRRDELDIEVLGAFAEHSGGRAFLLADGFAGRTAQIDKVLDTVADELRSQYTLGYYPAHPDDGQFHRIRVRSKTRHAVRARRGYLAAPAVQTSAVNVP